MTVAAPGLKTAFARYGQSEADRIGFAALRWKSSRVRRHTAAFTRAAEPACDDGKACSVQKKLGAMKGERRFGTLVGVDVVASEPVAAAAGREVVQGPVEPVPPEKPVECAVCPGAVLGISRYQVGSELRFDNRGCVERLFVAGAGRGSVPVPAQMTGKAQDAVRQPALVAEPVQRLEARCYLGLASQSRRPDDQSMWQARIVIAERVLEPRPVVGSCSCERIGQLRDEAHQELA